MPCDSFARFRWPPVAAAIEEVAAKEPGLLEPQLLGEELARLKQIGDMKVFARLRKVLSKAKAVAHADTYRYGL